MSSGWKTSNKYTASIHYCEVCNKMNRSWQFLLENRKLLTFKYIKQFVKVTFFFFKIYIRLLFKMFQNCQVPYEMDTRCHCTILTKAITSPCMSICAHTRETKCRFQLNWRLELMHMLGLHRFLKGDIKQGRSIKNIGMKSKYILICRATSIFNSDFILPSWF